MQYSEMKKILLMMPDAASRLEAVMDFGRQMPVPPSDAVCTEIAGCASVAEICRRGVNFYGRADSALVRGIVAILTAMVDGMTPDKIKQTDLAGEFASLGISLGTGRLGGVDSMIRFLQNL